MGLRTLLQHLETTHLSREYVSERELIVSGACLDLTEKQMEKMAVCPRHRHTLEKYWQAPKTCQHPNHTGKKSAVAGTHVINFKIAKEIENICGRSTSVGSRKCYFLNYLVGLFYHSRMRRFEGAFLCIVRVFRVH